MAITLTIFPAHGKPSTKEYRSWDAAMKAAIKWHGNLDVTRGRSVTIMTHINHSAKGGNVRPRRREIVRWTWVAANGRLDGS